MAVDLTKRPRYVKHTDIGARPRVNYSKAPRVPYVKRSS